VDEFLDVVELFVKVLETRVGLLTLRVRLGANKLFFDPLLHLLELAAVPRGPLELLLEHRGPLVDLLKHFVKVEVLRVRLAVHRLVLRSLLRRHDRAEVMKEVFVGVGRKLHKAIGLALIRTAISLDRRMDGFLPSQWTLAHTLSGGSLPVLELGPVWRGVVVARFAGEAGKIETGIGRVQAKVPHAMG